MKGCSNQAAAWLLLAVAMSSATAQSGAGPGGTETPQKKLALNEVIDTALKNHADLGVAQQGVVAANAQRTATRAQILPQGNTSFRMVRGKSVGRQSGANFAFVGDLDSEQGTMALNWSFDGGGNLWRYKGAGYNQRSSRAGVANAANNIRLNVTSAYIEVLRAQKLLDLARGNQRVAEAQLELVRARIQVGEAAPVDELPIRVQVENAKVQVLTASNSVRTSSSALREAMGLDFGPPLEIEELPEPAGPEAPTLQQCLMEAVRARPDFIQAKNDIMTSLFNYRATRTTSFPTLTVSYGNQQHLSEAFSLDSQWQISAFLFVPVLTWGGPRANARQALTQVKSNELFTEQLRKNISAQVEQSYLTLTSSSDRIAASHVEVEAATQNLEAQNTRYKLGASVNVVDVVTAQVQLNQAQTNLIEAIYDYYTAQAQLDFAIGRGIAWTAYRGTSETAKDRMQKMPSMRQNEASRKTTARSVSNDKKPSSETGG